MPRSYAFFSTCPKGLESLLLAELSSLGAICLKETVAGVYFDGPLSIAYRSCLWSRLANRILMPLLSTDCQTVDDLYDRMRTIAWDQQLGLDSTFAIDFTGSLPGVRHSHFAALRAKDAIADYFSQRFGRRPSVNTEKPDVRVNVRVNNHTLVVSVDLSGDSLHRRGYRLSGGIAPLKENLAAAILLRADWPGIAAQGGSLLDPMCGSGTLLIEGALMSANIAPGLLRNYWGFTGWLGHQSKLWNELLVEAQKLRAEALTRQWPEIRGYDASPSAIASAQQNIDRIGLEGKVRVLRKELASFTKPTHKIVDRGLVVTNPPYGGRLGEETSLIHLYRNLGQKLKSEFLDWRAAVFTGNPDLGKKMGLRSHQQYKMFNGTIPSKLLNFEVVPSYFVEDRSFLVDSGKVDSGKVAGGSVDSEQVGNEDPEKSQANRKPNDEMPNQQSLTSGAEMFANRLRKNRKQLVKWAKKNQLSCYRLYDADMPEYAVAIDYYQGWIHVSEYAPPATVDIEAAKQRLREVMAAIPVALDVTKKHILLKQRVRQKGSSQYQKQQQSGEFFEINEGLVKLLVNLKDYLDTGLFLDHRPVRLKIAEMASGNRFLNLFSYTAAASVHAAMGGATFTDSVDLSSTYLGWASKNMALNGFSDVKHRMIQANVMDWVKTCNNQYDLILLDPPTFSNSKKMLGTLDIQRDHVQLINDVSNLLSRDGLLIFSNNSRKFKLDENALDGFDIENITHWSIDKDFQRSKKIHQSWFIRHCQ